MAGENIGDKELISAKCFDLAPPKLYVRLSKNIMFAILKIISFYLAVIVLLSITFIFTNIYIKFGVYSTLFIWLAYCGVPLFILSYATGVNKPRFWSNAETTVPSIVVIVGHLGLAYAILYYIQMVKAGYGAGIVFIPSVLWVFIFYGIGAFWCVSRVVSVMSQEIKHINQ